MMRSLFSGVSGLKTHQTKMDVIGNNISNVNTVAFKSSSTTFSDLMYQTTSNASGATATRGGTNAKQIGLGVTNGATKISITGQGSAQSTGDALDIRLSDTKTTNFFIVSNGTENVYTRAGSFYIDGAGNLAMTTTGFLVQGWGVNNDGTINKNGGLSSLQVMSAANQTSPPEATTNATFSGVLDENDPNVTDEGGYVKSFTFYDNRGYSYTAKFAIKNTDAEGEYTIRLTAVYKGSDETKNLLTEYASKAGNAQSDIFGQRNTESRTFNLQSSYEKGTVKGGFSYDSDRKLYVFKNQAGTEYTYDASGYTGATGGAGGGTAQTCTFTKSGTGTGPDSYVFTFEDIFGVDDDTNIDTYPAGSAWGVAPEATVEVFTYKLTFNKADGTLTSAGDAGKTLMFNASKFSTPDNNADGEEITALEDIEIDFSTMLNYDNGKISTVAATRGALDGTTGAGKKLGAMTGLQVDNSGRIFGSYSNGNTTLLGQIAVAQFANASGLEEIGDNCYKATLNTGEENIVDVSADGSSMNTGQLEMSNVDLSAQFTDMIITQRGFQANSRIITVSDTLLEELINLKR